MNKRQPVTVFYLVDENTSLARKGKRVWCSYIGHQVYCQDLTLWYNVARDHKLTCSDCSYICHQSSEVSSVLPFKLTFLSTASSREMTDIPGRWSHVSKLLERAGPLAHPEFQPNPEVRKPHYHIYLR